MDSKQTQKQNSQEEIEEIIEEEQEYVASQFELIMRRFKRHKLAISGITLLCIFYFVVIFAPFLAPSDPYKNYDDYLYAPPQQLHFLDEAGNFHLRPFVYGITSGRDPVTFEKVYEIDKDKQYPLKFFVRGADYELFKLIPSNLHLFGVEEPGVLFLFGTDKLGRDLFSRNLYAGRISLSIGLIGVGIAFILGCIMGGISGYFAGTIDMIIQRIIEFLISIPTIPLWMALAAALPTNWSQIKVFMAITVILALRNWAGLARVVRGKIISLRDEDFVIAARLGGVSEPKIISKHLLPLFMSYLIVNITLQIPAMIIGETALSFLGLGLRAPTISWGVLLNEAQNIRTLALHPWLLLPGAFVVIAVLSFNAVGDGLRDAADPYKNV